MKPNSRFLLFPVFICVASLPILFAQAQKKSPVAFPTGYRHWTMVKTMVIYARQNSLFTQFGGLHNVYVNDAGLATMKQGKVFPDGTVLAFDLFDARNEQGAIQAGERKFVAVMKKNTKLYGATGGWGFEVFQGNAQKGSLQDAKPCFDCHTAQKRTDYVFSSYTP